MFFMVPMAGAFGVQGSGPMEKECINPENVPKGLAGSYTIEKKIPYNSEIYILALSDPTEALSQITVLVHSKTNIVIGYSYEWEGQTFYVTYHNGKYQDVMANGNTMTNL